MLPLRIRERVGDVSGHVRAARVRADAGGIEAGDREIRRARQIAAARAGVEAEAYRIEAAIGIRERLVEVVQADEELVRERWRQDRVVDGRIVLHSNRADLKVIRDQRTDRRRLTSLAEERAKREPVIVIQAVIQLHEEVVAVAGLGRRIEVVVRRRRAAQGVGRPQAAQERSGHRVHGDRVLLQELHRCGLIRGRRHRRQRLVSDLETLMFVGREEKGLVPLKRTAQREAVVLVAQFVLGRVGRRERRQRRERLVAVVVVRAAGGPVRPRLDDQVHRSAGIAPGFGGRLRLD